jgi:hypothetical protein
MASMVSLTDRSVRGIPEFHEFQPIGGVCCGGGPHSDIDSDAVLHPLAAKTTMMSDTRIDHNRRTWCLPPANGFAPPPHNSLSDVIGKSVIRLAVSLRARWR